MTEQQRAQGAPKGLGSFCVPRVVIEALLGSKQDFATEVTAYEICTYLVLAKYTDESGRYSPASIKAVNTATGANKLKGGPVSRSIERLKTIHAVRVDRVLKKVSNGRSGKAAAMVDQWVEEKSDLGPILFDRETWQTETGEILPDGPTERGMVRYVLPDFGEEKASRVWFGNNLVGGIGGFTQPLKALKNAGDEAARLLLALYAANDMELWGGVRPCGPGHGPWHRYEPVSADVHLYSGVRLIRARDEGTVATIDKRISGGSNEAYFDAVRALKSAGLIYEVVMVLNRNAKQAMFASGEEYGQIPDDAEPYYELDARSVHGYKPAGEEGIGGATANTAGEFGYPVALEGGRFDGTYAAFVPAGYPAMIAGIYRLRFRVANPKNAGVKGAWAGIHQRNREAFELVQAIRSANNNPALIPPWEASKPKTPASNEESQSNGLVPFNPLNTPQ